MCRDLKRALGEIRTHDPWYRKPVLYPLSYEGVYRRFTVCLSLIHI